MTKPSNHPPGGLSDDAIRVAEAALFALDSPQNAPAAVKAAIQREQYRSLTRLVPFLYAIVGMTTVTMSLTIHSVTRSPLGRALPMLLVAVALVRALQWTNARRHVETIGNDGIRRALKVTTHLGAAIGGAFALMAAFGAQGYGTEQVVVMLVIWTVAIACAFCLFALPEAAAWVVFATGAPLAGTMFASGDRLQVSMACVMTAISALVIYVLRESFRSFVGIVEARLATAQRHRQAAEARDAATAVANTDALTDMPNRRRFQIALDGRVRSAAESGAAFAVGLIDLDGFKPINDVHGHMAGDRVLKAIGARLSACMAGRGLAARMGGDEFALIAEGVADAEAAQALGRELAAAFAVPINVGAVALRVNCTMGLSLFPGPGESAETLMRHADMALYRAKGLARGSLAVFDANDERKALRRGQLEQGLLRALADDLFEPHFQPIIDLADGRILSFEALARWNDPQLGPVPPGEFIPIAEQIGAIGALTDGLLRKSALAASSWPSEIRLSFNMTTEQLVKPDAAPTLLALLAQCGLPPERFEAEVTESGMMRDLVSARRTIEVLRSAGATIALDDFGTGHSSLSQIRDLPLDKVKIDKSFIDRICLDGRIAGLARSIVELCARLDLPCVAEGIESADQLAELIRHGCAGGQGHLFAPAIPAGEVARFLDGRRPAMAA